MRAGGRHWPQACRFAILPQVAPNPLSYALLRFEINLRSAPASSASSAPAGSAGTLHRHRLNYYEEISAIILLVILAVASIDLMSETLRHRVIGRLA